jgi:alpha-galactosidase
MKAALDFTTIDGRIALRQLGLPGQSSWASGAQPAFGVVADGELITAESAGLSVRSVASADAGNGMIEEIVRCDHASLEIEWHVKRYSEPAVVETRVAVRNRGPKTITIGRLDAVALELSTADCELSSFTSSWGLEFEAVHSALTGSPRLESLAGRSSQGPHPCFALTRPDGAVLFGTVAWSGNWVFRFDEKPDGAHLLTGGLHDHGFEKVLQPGASVESPLVVLAFGSDHDLNTVSVPLARTARAHWAPRNALSQQLPVEWNHWWSYEDGDINAAVFAANADVAAELGMELCTLDAGWFGPADPETSWTDYRGDWDLVNTERFPAGIRAVADRVHDRGMRFGLWCEIEALGPKARLAETRPDFPATRDGAPLGYVCFGNPAAAAWAVQTLGRLVRDFGADWIKLDFNLDPGLGCDRTDHGHGSGDGLFEHYRAYYDVLAQVRADHPEVVLENCSSGGLRIDLGLLRQTHLTFLSDPDWPEHGLQILWGASIMLPPDQLLHWGYSEWRADHPEQTLNPRDPGLQPHQIDYYRRIAMLGATGCSYRLPDLPDEFRARLRDNVRLYQDLVRPYVRTADLYRLTGQPGRYGRGERWAAFQYAADDHLVLAFRLPGGASDRSIRLELLDPDRWYEIERVGSGDRTKTTGRALLTEGLAFSLPEEGSQIVMVRGL